MPNLPSKKLQALELILSYWQYYGADDKFFIYNPYSQKFILGIRAVDDITGAPYVLYPADFFVDDIVSSAKAFKYYCVIEKDQIVYNSFENFKQSAVDELSIQALLECFIKKSDFSSACHNENPSLFKRTKHNIVRLDDSYDEWKKLFTNIQNGIVSHKFEKVVAARKIDFQCVDGFDFSSVMLNLFEFNINSYIFAYENDGSIFLGASPELLVEKKGSNIKSYALAGTIKKTSADVLSQGQSFLRDEKNIYEHNIVINAIAKAMQKLGKNVQIGHSHILELKNVLHIKTDICAEECVELCKDVTNEVIAEQHENYHNFKLIHANILKWVCELHPTPALGGSPKANALTFIKKYESFVRGHYGAPFGVVDAHGDGFFIVAIRSATIQDKLLSAYAGCGIVAQSDCDEEFEEIDTKLKTIIEAL